MKGMWAYLLANNLRHFSIFIIVKRISSLDQSKMSKVSCLNKPTDDTHDYYDLVFIMWTQMVEASLSERTQVKTKSLFFLLNKQVRFLKSVISKNILLQFLQVSLQFILPLKHKLGIKQSNRPSATFWWVDLWQPPQGKRLVLLTWVQVQKSLLSADPLTVHFSQMPTSASNSNCQETKGFLITSDISHNYLA
jgi:hypothetical protein